VPQPDASDQAAKGRGRKREAFGGREPVAQALAGAHIAIRAKTDVEQRFTRDDVRRAFAPDRERRGVGSESNEGFA
jgi:hypothetical protein